MPGGKEGKEAARPLGMIRNHSTEPVGRVLDGTTDRPPPSLCSANSVL
jgi:hypothetical protein